MRSDCIILSGWVGPSDTVVIYSVWSTVNEVNDANQAVLSYIQVYCQRHLTQGWGQQCSMNQHHIHWEKDRFHDHRNLLLFISCTRPVIGQFCGPYSTGIRPAKFESGRLTSCLVSFLARPADLKDIIKIPLNSFSRPPTVRCGSLVFFFFS